MKTTQNLAENSVNGRASGHSLPRLVGRLGDLDRLEGRFRKDRQSVLIEVGAKMRENREQAKMSCRELSRRLGVSAAFLSDMELGRRKYSIEWCRKAMQIFHSANSTLGETE